MNEDLQKQLADLLAKLMDVASDGAQWASTQIPPLVQEKIAFGRAWETTALVLCVVAFIGSIQLFRWFVKNEDRFGDATFFGAVFSVGGAVFVLAHGYQHLARVLLVWFAPRLYIVEWLRTLIR